MKKIAILASGEGSNAMNIIHHFNNGEKARVSLLVSNKGDAPVIERAMLADVPVMVLDNKKEFSKPGFIKFMAKQKFDLIVLAGFLLLLPEKLIKAYPDKIVNIHPALLPKHGGKGMYGINVHHAVLEAKEKESGISIHFVNEKFDEGKVIFQAKCNVSDNETLGSLVEKVQALEHEHYPKEIEKLLE